MRSEDVNYRNPLVRQVTPLIDGRCLQASWPLATSRTVTQHDTRTRAHARARAAAVVQRHDSAQNQPDTLDRQSKGSGSDRDG